jgi:hypothetical protein
MERNFEEQGKLSYDKLIKLATSTAMFVTLNFIPDVALAVPQSVPTTVEENVESLKNLKESKPQPNVPYSPEQKQILDDLFEKPGAASIRITIDQSANTATISTVYTDGSTGFAKVPIVLPKPDKAKNLRNGYYLNGTSPGKYNPGTIAKYGSKNVNIVEPLDNVSILNPIVIQDIVPDGNNIKVLQHDPDPNGQRKMHSVLVPKNIGALAAKSGATLYDRSGALEKGVFTNLPRGRQVIIGNQSILNKHVQPNQVGDLTWNCFRLPVSISNQLLHDTIKFRQYRAEQPRDYASMPPNVLYDLDLKEIPAYNEAFTTMIKVVP